VNADLFRLNCELEREHWWFAARRKILSQIARELVEPSPETTVLDVGCGTGGNVAALAGDYHCVGVDPSAEAIRLAKARHPQVEFIRGLAPDDVRDAARKAKLVLLADVLEHVPDDRALLAGLVGATSAGTHFLVTVPADPSLWSPHDERHGHYRRYDRKSFERLWRDLPVAPLLVSHFNTRLYPLVRLVRTVNRRRGRTRGRNGTDLVLPPSFVNRALERVFRGESRVLTELLHGKRRRGHSFGISLMAVLRREAGAVAPGEPLCVAGSAAAFPVEGLPVSPS
jgi:SAM-dependent methyltransferase